MLLILQAVARSVSTEKVGLTCFPEGWEGGTPICGIDRELRNKRAQWFSVPLRGRKMLYNQPTLLKYNCFQWWNKLPSGRWIGPVQDKVRHSQLLAEPLSPFPSPLSSIEPQLIKSSTRPLVVDPYQLEQMLLCGHFNRFKIQTVPSPQLPTLTSHLIYNTRNKFPNFPPPPPPTPQR